MKTLLLLLLGFNFTYSAHEQRKGFLVASPSTLLCDSHENICVSLHNNSAPVRVTVTLVGAYTNQVLSSSASVIDTGGCVQLYIPKTEEHIGKLVVRLQSEDSEMSANSERNVFLQRDPLLVLISTDKPQYKPGQDVSFRVLSLTHTLKPHNGKINKIWIETPNGIRVQQWKDVEVIKHGLAQLQFPLDKETLLGQWKIKAEHTSSDVVEKIFVVKEYISVKFEVTVKPPREIVPDSERVSWNICAKYSYGEVVQGDSHIEITLIGTRTADQPSINNAIKLNSYTGCAEFTMKGSDLGLADHLVQPSAVLATVTVTEKGTGVSNSASVQTLVQHQAFHLHFHCSQYFKPGLPYKGNVVMKTMSGLPRSGMGEIVQICVKARYSGQLDVKLLHCWNYTTDYNSQVTFALPHVSDPLNLQLITIVAVAVDYPTKLYPGSGEVMMIQPSVTHFVKPWFSPSNSYIDVWTRTTLACGTTHSVTIYYSVTSYNTTTPTFYYMVEGRGDLLKLRTVVPREESVIHSNDVSSREGSTVRAWKLLLFVNHLMSPRSRLTVYYVRSDGEVVAASANLLVDRCFQNRVRVRWEESQVVPKQEAHLLIRASPNSLCGVTVINRQVAFNTSQPPSDSDHVWKELTRFNLRKPAREESLYCRNKSPSTSNEGTSRTASEGTSRTASEGTTPTPTEESPPDYELRRRRSVLLLPQDYYDHVDAITAFDDLGVTVMSNLLLESRPCSKPSSYPTNNQRSWIFSPGKIYNRPLEMTDNLIVQRESEPDEDQVQSMIRDYFPDTWIWSLLDTGRDGEVKVNGSAPDSITSWDTRVLCVSERDGLGVAAPTTLTVFMPFFLHVETPYSIKIGERVTVKVIVYNYMHHSLPIQLRLPMNERLGVNAEMIAVFCVEPLSPHSHLITLTALSGGEVNLTVEATVQPMKDCGSPDITMKSDTVIKKLLVKSDGYFQQKSYSAFICPRENADPSVTWSFQLPEEDNLVSGSASLQFSVTADLFGPAMENLENLVMLPMGCGEQNLAKLAPNIFVLKYMDAAGHTDKQLRETALKNIKKGYQRQLTFRRSDGSFSPFGDKDEEGSMWLTAAVVKTLSEAKMLIEVDEDVLQSSIVWVTRQQLENGCFPVVGQVFHTGLEDEGTVFSSLVVANLAASEVLLPESVRSNAEFCMAAGVSSADPHTVALTALALFRLGARDKADKALRQLLSLAIMENDVVHWGKPDASEAQNIATTSYVVLLLVELGGSDHVLIAQKAVRWIAKRRNENGGFISTQDTVVALEALTNYITSLPRVNQTDLMVFVRGNQLTKTLRLSDDNKLVQQKLTITDDIPANLTAAVVGEGCAFVQSNLKYNVRRPEEGSLLDVQISSSSISTADPCSIQELQVCASASRPGQVTNMALLSVLLVTGYALDKSHISKISHPRVKKWEEVDDQVLVYLTQVGNLPICFSLVLVRRFAVEDPLPASVTLIDYYHPEVATSKSYSLECSPALPPLDNPVLLSDEPDSQVDMFDNFHDVDFELEVPDGDEGPKPVYACAPESTLPVCQGNSLKTVETLQVQG